MAGSYLQSMQSPAASPASAGASPSAGTAGMQMGGNMLSAYLAAKAEEEANRRQMLADAARLEGEMTSNALKSIMGGATSALR